MLGAVELSEPPHLFSTGLTWMSMPWSGERDFTREPRGWSVSEGCCQEQNADLLGHGCGEDYRQQCDGGDAYSNLPAQMLPLTPLLNSTLTCPKVLPMKMRLASQVPLL